MKIFVVSDKAYNCGASIATYRLARGLHAAGHQVDYFYFRPGPIPLVPGLACHHMLPWRRPLTAVLKRLSWDYDSLRLAWLRWHSRHIAEYLHAAIDATRPDVLNLHNMGELLTHQDILNLARRIPTFWTMHDGYALTWFGYQYQTLDGRQVSTPWRIYEPYDHDLMRQVIAQVSFITPSRWLRDEMLLRFPPGALRIDTVPNGLDPTEFHPEPRAVARRHFNLPEADRVLLFVASRLGHDRKNLLLLIEAMERLPTTGVTVAAIGASTRYLRRQFPNVRLLGESYDPRVMRLAYSAADLFVIPSLVDNLPNTVLESLFCGTPVAGSNAGGIPEMVIPGHSGWLFDPRNRDELAATLNHCLEHPAELAELGNRGGAWIREQYNITRQVDGYIKLFDQ